MQFEQNIYHDMQKIFDYCWNNQIINCNVQFQDSHKELHMHTYFPYMPQSCGKTNSYHINQFVNGKWLYRPYFIAKLKNFHGCPLVAIVRDVAPYSFKSKIDPRIYRGSEAEIAYELSYKLNFSLILRENDEDDRWWPDTIRSGFDMVNCDKNKY